MGLAKEFKEFAMKGNVVDMAVGVIIGTAFGKIVSSLVGDVRRIDMPSPSRPARDLGSAAHELLHDVVRLPKHKEVRTGCVSQIGPGWHWPVAWPPMT